MDWQQFVMHLEALPADDVEEIFSRHGAEAVTLSDAGDTPVLEPAPGETPLWRKVSITGLFPAAVQLEKLQEDLLRSFKLDALPAHRIEILEDRVWEREWLKDFRPMQFGRRLWVCPGEFSVAAADAVVVRLDPGLAFGTGTHPTTAMCLEWLDSLTLSGKRVLDYGCGSGILSIAALLLGAETVTAFDIDHQAITATRQNALRNDVASRVHPTMKLSAADREYDVVIANILAAPLIQHASSISQALRHRGRIALSGILTTQAAEVSEAYAKWIDFEPAAVRSPWARLAGVRA